MKENAPLHEALALGVAQHAALAPAALRDQAPGAVDAYRAVWTDLNGYNVFNSRLDVLYCRLAKLLKVAAATREGLGVEAAGAKYTEGLPCAANLAREGARSMETERHRQRDSRQRRGHRDNGGPGAKKNTPVGWNCTNSRSCSGRPARATIALPSPVHVCADVALKYARP